MCIPKDFTMDFSINKISQRVGQNPFGVQPKTGQGPAVQAFQGGQSLDPAMLSEKRANFFNGLGGTNNPDDHKLFYSA